MVKNYQKNRSKWKKSKLFNEDYPYERISIFNKTKFLRKNNLIFPNFISKFFFRMKFLITYIHYMFISFFLSYYKIDKTNTPFLFLMNVYSSIENIYVNITETINYYPDNIEHVIVEYDDVLKRPFNKYASWNENIYPTVKEWEPFSEEFINNNAMHSKGKIYSIKNVIVNEGTTFAYKNTFINVRKDCFYLWFNFYQGNIIYHIDKALILGNEHCRKNFGHTIHDFFIPLAYIPDGILNNVFIICQCIKKVSLELFKAFGIEESRVIFLPKDCWASCNTLYIIDEPSPSLTYYGIDSLHFKEICDKAFNLKKIESNQYVLINRERGARRFRNMNSILEHCKKSFPEYKWIELKDFYKTINETAKIWASIKFAFMPTGSNVVKMYFMHPGTAICVGEAETVDNSQMRSASAIGIFSRWFYVEGMIHDYIPSFDGWNVNIPFAIENIKYALYAAKYQKWPSSPSFTL